MNRWRDSNFQSFTIPNTGIYLWLQGIVIFGMALSIRYQFIDWPLSIDHYFHILAGRSWAMDGSFTIFEGEYKRGYLYTALIGWLFSIFGESIEIARIPSLLAGSLNVLLVFLFVNRYVGFLAALITSLFFIFDPVAIQLSTQIRFYAIQGLLFWTAAILVFYASQYSVSLQRKLGMALIILPTLAIATHLQPITLIGTAGLIVWIIIEHGNKIFDVIRRFMLNHTTWVVIIGLTVSAVIFLNRDSISDILEMYRSSSTWAMKHKDSPLYYPYQIMRQYPVFWSFFPIAVLLVIRSHKRIVLYCLVMFLSLLILHSFAGNKINRYFNYALPFLFIIWGIFLAKLFNTFRDSLLEILSGRLGEYRQFSGNLAAIILFFYAILSLNIVSYYETTKKPLSAESVFGRWAAAEPLLKQLADQVDTILVTASNRAIYHIGRYDYAIAPSQVNITDTRREFGRDPRVGGYIIGTSQSIKKIIDCTASGLFVSGRQRWENATIGLDKEGRNILLERTQKIQTPAEWGLIVRSWKSPNHNHAPECEDLPKR